MVTIKLIVAGLIAFVPQGPGQATALLPSSADWNLEYSGYPLPAHTAELGILEDDLEVGSKCSDLHHLNAKLVAGQSASGKDICWIPLKGRQLSLGSVSSATANPPVSVLGDFKSIGPSKIAAAKGSFVNGTGTIKYLEGRVAIRYESWRVCGHVASTVNGEGYVYEWEFRELGTAAETGSATRALASSQELMLRAPNPLTLTFLDLGGTPLTPSIKYKSLTSVEMVVQNSTTHPGSSSTIADHFLMYHQFSDQGAAEAINKRRIPHRMPGTPLKEDLCASEFKIDCSVPLAPLSELWNEASQAARAALDALWEPKSQDNDVIVGSESSSVALCVNGPPLCPQAVFPKYP